MSKSSSRLSRARPSARGASVLRQWKAISRRIRRAVDGLSSRQLDRRGGSEGLSVREYAHHLIEANLVVSTIVIAAVGKPGSVYDWSWLMPDSDWTRALVYGQRSLSTALELMDVLTRYVADLLAVAPENMSCYVKLVGSQRKHRRTTVEVLLTDEVTHANTHLADVAAIRRSAVVGRRKALA